MTGFLKANQLVQILLFEESLTKVPTDRANLQDQSRDKYAISAPPIIRLYNGTYAQRGEYSEAHG